MVGASKETLPSKPITCASNLHEGILDEATSIDEKEDQEDAPEKRGDEFPEAPREQEDSLEQLRDAKKRLNDQE
jgi:hypothetical protein